MSILENFNNLKLRIVAGEPVSEADVRQAINEDIRNYLKTKYDKEIIFKNEVKTSTCTFIDSKWENFIIEYKRPTVSLGDRQREQLIYYLKDLGNYSWGILTNGKEMEIYNYSFEKKEFVKDELLSGEINEEQFRYICDVLANKEELVLTENNVNDCLGIGTNNTLIKIIFKKLTSSTNAGTSFLYNEWQKLFNLSDEHDVLDLEKKANVVEFYQELFNTKIDTVEKEHKALFSIQTYYSIILKLVLYKIISNKMGEDQRKSRFLQDFFKGIESNDFYRQYNIQNLIDGDFFSWYLNEFSEEEFGLFYDKISEIATVETAHINLLFIRLYENIFPFWVRHSMGEYYTPLYLAKSIVDNTISLVEDEEIKLLDPTCGSGIFLIYALNKGIKNVYGVDINPLAVLTSKINYLINNFDLSKPVEIPIYLGDSTYFPYETNINGIDCYQYEMTTSIHDHYTIDFVFSQDVINEPLFFKILDEIEIQIRNKNFASAINIIKSYSSFHYEELSEYYDKLIATLIDLEKRNLNSI